MSGAIGKIGKQPDGAAVARSVRLLVGEGAPALRVPFRLDAASMGRAAVLGLTVFALAFGALALTRFHGPVASVWLANAVIVGLVMRAPRRDHRLLLLVAFGAHIVANLANQQSPLPALTLALISIVESVIVIYPLTRALAARERFDDGYVIVRFLLYAGVVGPLCGALLAAGALALISGVDFGSVLLQWYLADALGLLTLGALFMAAQAKVDAVPRLTSISGWAGVILSSMITAFAFTRGVGPVLFAIAPVLTIATLRTPLVGTMVGLVSCAAIAVAATASGVGPLAAPDLDPATRIYLLQAFIASLLFVILPVRALVGERDRLSAAIAQSDRLFARIAEASPAGTIHFDPLGRMIFVDQRWTGLTGLDHGALEGNGWLAAIDPADRSAATSLWSRARATLEPCSGEYRFLAHGAPAGFAELHFYSEVEDGRILGFVARLSDVTSRRLAEDALRERETLYQLVTENAQDVVLRLGLDGCPLYVSGAALRVTGFAPLELVGRPLATLIHDDDRPIFAQTLARLAAGGADAAIEFRLRHRDGHFSWFESCQRPLFDEAGAPTQLVASLRNIDRRRQSEATAAAAAAKLHEANRLMVVAEELAGVGSWHFDTREDALVLAPQIDRILNRERVDRPHARDIIKLVEDADRRPLLACLARARRGGNAECAVRVGSAERVRTVRLVARAEHRRGAFVGWVGVAHDVTEKVEAETALIEARDEAQAAARAKSHFLATMSHEIRTPMTGVLGMIDLLRDHPSPREREHYVGALSQSAAMLVSVLDDVLDFSKIDSGTLRLERSDFDLEVLATGTIDLFGTAASRKGLSVAFESSCLAPPLVRGDAVRLQQILSNLLSNAIKFTERGHITLSLGCTAAGGGDTRYVFAIADTGIGLEASQIDELFEPFIQAEVTTARRYGGTGLGLPISRGLVEAMGGKLEISSHLGRGSTFTFDITLPAGQAVDDAGHDQALDPQRAEALEVLVAEDNPINQMLIAALVRRMGHHVHVVANGRAAVEAAAVTRFDAILMDMQMPELDGLAATRAIRASGGRCAAAPIFALTADASAERRRFYDGAGLTDFLTKPIDRVALATRLALIKPPLKPGDGLRAVATPTLVFDVERIDELRVALGSLRFDALLALLVTECRERPDRLRAALHRRDLPAFHAEAHSLTGAATSIGAAALGCAAGRLEQACDLATAEPMMARLDSTARATLIAARHLIRQPPGDRAIA